jgi:Xaa-Pro dipeptidase
MALHFTPEELAGRRAAAVAAMQKRGLDGLLMFRQESMYYLTGYDTFGYVFFQCLYLGADGTLTLLTRAPDRLQATHTSIVTDIRIWVDRPDANPALDLRNILKEHGCHGRQLGVEYEAYGLTARNGKRLEAALEGFCTLADASDLVSRLRLVKSPAEIAYVRKAAELADLALDEAHRLAGQIGRAHV